MKLRKHTLPRTFPDTVSFVFIILIVPFSYCFELFYVLPSMYSAWSFWFILHAFMGSFVLVNIASNFVLIMVVDTSFERKTIQLPPKYVSPRWHFCDTCDMYVPPRAWHCSDCGCCVLKRDHHCQFTGCCVGHRNHRYFFFFVLYMAIGTTYAFYLHSQFIYRSAVHYLGLHRRHSGSIILALARSLSYSTQNCFMVPYCVIFFGMGTSLFFLYYHASTIAKGMVLYERARGIRDFDSGSMRQNFIGVLGKRWYVAWLSPLVTSELPGNGVKWTKFKHAKQT